MGRWVRFILGLLLLGVVLWLIVTALFVGLVIAAIVAAVVYVLALFGVRPKPAPVPEAHDPLAIGIYTGVEDYAENGRRTISWTILDGTWEEFDRALDRFLEQAVRVSAEVYTDAKVEWLVLQYEPTEARLSVDPSDDADPEGDEYPRVRFHLTSQFLQVQFAHAHAESGEKVGREVWERISRSLREGPAAAALEEARPEHPMRLRGFDYSPGVDLATPRLTAPGEPVSGTPDNDNNS